MNPSSKKIFAIFLVLDWIAPSSRISPTKGATGRRLRLLQQCIEGKKKSVSYPGRPRDVQPYRETQPKIDIRPFYRIVSGQSDEWRLRFFVRLAIELLTAGSQAADGAGFQLFASRSKKQIPIIRTDEDGATSRPALGPFDPEHGMGVGDGEPVRRVAGTAAGSRQDGPQRSVRTT